MILRERRCRISGWSLTRFLRWIYWVLDLTQLSLIFCWFLQTCSSCIPQESRCAGSSTSWSFSAPVPASLSWWPISSRGLAACGSPSREDCSSSEGSKTPVSFSLSVYLLVHPICSKARAFLSRVCDGEYHAVVRHAPASNGPLCPSLALTARLATFGNLVLSTLAPPKTPISLGTVAPWAYFWVWSWDTRWAGPIYSPTLETHKKPSFQMPPFSQS